MLLLSLAGESLRRLTCLLRGSSRSIPLPDFSVSLITPVYTGPCRLPKLIQPVSKLKRWSHV